MSDRLDLSGIPPSVVMSMRNQPMTWHSALAEIIDNGFDFGAQKIAVQVSRIRGGVVRVFVSDDGHGCDDIEKMMTIGGHGDRPSEGRVGLMRQRLGIYGIGLKDAAMWLGSILTVQTVTEEQYSYGHVDWDKLAKQDGWDTGKKDVRPRDGDPRGTEVIIHSQSGRNMPAHGGRQLADDLAFTFSPGLESGRQISFQCGSEDAVQLRPWKMPKRYGVKTESFSIRGKRVSLDVGIVDGDRPNYRSGFSYYYGHRVLLTTAKGAMGHDVSRVCGTVTLGDGWGLSKHKDDVTDVDFDDLEKRIFAACRPLILQAEREQQKLFRSELTTDLTRLLQAAVGGVGEPEREKAKREPAENHTGAVAPRGSEAKHTRAARTQPGDTFTAAGRWLAGVRVDWQPLREDPPIAGKVDVPGNRVILNELNSGIEVMRQTRNLAALLVVVCQLVASAGGRGKFSGQRLLPGIENDSTDSIFAKLLESFSSHAVTQTRKAAKVTA